MIEQYLQDNYFQYDWIVDQKIFCIDEQIFLVVGNENSQKLFDEHFEIILDTQEQMLVDDCTHYCFKFGEHWFYSKIGQSITFTLFRYIGTGNVKTYSPYLGVHGGYEICNGSAAYENWVKKAKFFGIKSLGICERNTLAGTLVFQNICKSSGIKSIIGESVLVKDRNKYTYYVKLFCKDEKGWNNLLWINKQINVDHCDEKFVDEDYLVQRLEGLICVFGCETNLSDDFLAKYYNNKHAQLYFQIDPVKWKSDEKDKKYLEGIKKFYDSHHWAMGLNPIILCDSYYLDKSDWFVKDTLNKIGKIGFENQSDDQYFKSSQDIESEIQSWFRDRNDAYVKFITACHSSLERVDELCQFEIKTKELHLPVYELSEQEKEKFKDTDELFWHLIEKGLEEKIIAKGKDVDKYIERIDVEVEVLKEGNVVDYFLILHDIINWCDQQNILIGIGRGSSAGSLVAYLLGLVKVDPLDYDLLFERFLNRGRVGKSLPDADTDCESSRRDEVKRYIEQRYGINNVCSIGTYGTFKLKAGFNDLCRIAGQSPQMIRYFSAILNEDENGYDFESLFKQAITKEQFKAFVNENYEALNQLPLILRQCKTTSVHAAGVVIAPKVYGERAMTIYDWMPVKMMDGVLVSEWEGPELESAGFLKNDILGIKQLDKIGAIFKLIQQNGKQVPDLNNIDVADPNVYELFKQGYNQDLFHFGSLGLTQYSQQLKPDNIEELIAMIAAYRPGAMEFGAHKDLVSIKFGRKEPQYDFGLKEVTESTNSLYLYQEQIMKACQVLGGLNLVEADDVRRGLGKKDIAYLSKYKDRFIQSAVEKGCLEYEAHGIWNKLEAFAKYGFNKSHSVCYSLTGYFCQFLKYHYPIEFWTVALQYADDDEIPGRINELSRLGTIKITSPDINNSQLQFTSDFATNTIYWSINKIKRVGEVAVQTIIEQRNSKGKFFSLSDFVARIEKRKVNKACVVNLILAGAFDQIENVVTIKDRRAILIKYFQSIKEDIPSQYLSSESNYEWFWYLQQVVVSNSGTFDFEQLVPMLRIDRGQQLFCTPERVLLEDNVGCKALVIGVLREVIEKKSKKGEFGHLVLEQNNAPIEVTLWNETWVEYKNQIIGNEDKIIAIVGTITFDKWRSKNVIHSQQDSVIQII